MAPARAALSARPLFLILLFVTTLTRGIVFLSRLFGGVAAAMIVTAALVVCQMVFLRYALGESTIWQTEFVTYILIAATFLGSPYVLLVRGHVSIGLLPLYLSPRYRLPLAWFGMLLSFAFCLLMAWLGWQLVREAYLQNWHSETLWEPRLWIPYLSIPAGMGLLALQYAVEMIQLWTGKADPFDLKPEEHP